MLPRSRAERRNDPWRDVNTPLTYHAGMTESWQPLVDDAGERARIAATVRELVLALEAMTLDERDIDAHCDRAIVRAYIAPEDDDGEALALAAGALARVEVPSLFGGAARVGWTLAHLGEGEQVDEICAAIDAGLLRQLDAWRGPFELVHGLVGLGVYALERGAAGQALAGRVMVRLAELARPRAGGLAWYSEPENLPPARRELEPRGYWDLGLAHGTPGVMALAARCSVADVSGERARELLAGATAYVLASAPATSAARFPPWQVDGKAEPVAPRPGLAWCYGDLGVSAALLAAARVDDRWSEPALELARSCAERSCDIAEVGICHGAAGIAHVLNRAWQTTGEAAFATAARTWLSRAIALAGGAPKDATLLTGTAGLALVLHAAVSELEPEWDRLLLLGAPG
jgi:hypothetical protein